MSANFIWTLRLGHYRLCPETVHLFEIIHRLVFSLVHAAVEQSQFQTILLLFKMTIWSLESLVPMIDL